MRQPGDLRIFDIHHHVGRLDFGASLAPGQNRPAMAEDISTRLAFMDKNSIEGALLMPASGYPNSDGLADTRKVNDYVASYRDSRPDRFPGAVGTVSPLEGESAIEEIDRCITRLGMKGIVWHHRFQGAFLNHSAMDMFLERIRFHRVLAFVHIIAESTLELHGDWRCWRINFLT